MPDWKPCLSDKHGKGVSRSLCAIQEKPVQEAELAAVSEMAGH